MVSKSIPSFGEMFSMLSYQEIGTSTIQSRADAALPLRWHTLVFLLPRSTVRLGMEAIIVPQLDNRHRPCNLNELLPLIRNER